MGESQNTANPNAPSSQPQLAITPPPSAPAPVPAPLLAPVPFMAIDPASASSTGIPEYFMFKSRLQEYTQRESLPLPVYQTVNEGNIHLPKFRSSVLVGGVQYSSSNFFSRRKQAEQDVARIALEHLPQTIKDEQCPISEDTIFCKSILNEYAVKMRLEKPTYNTVQAQPARLLPIFTSSVVFNGITYTGGAGRTKKDAEQLVARVVILSLMGHSESGTIISDIIKSKRKLYVALHKQKDSHPVQHNAMTMVSKDKEVEAIIAGNNVPTSSIPQATSDIRPPHHEFTIQKPEPIFEQVELPIAFVRPVLAQPLDAGSSSGNKRRKNKKKANKKIRTEHQLPIAAMPLNQTSS